MKPTMLYFDTDVLVHFVVNQDSAKHQKATELIRNAAEQGTFFVSYLSLHEFAFVLAKLQIKLETINENLDTFLKSSPVNFTSSQFKRARELAGKIGYKHFADCIHTAIAEELCLELITYNADDFKKIKKLTKLKITIL